MLTNDDHKLLVALTSHTGVPRYKLRYMGIEQVIFPVQKLGVNQKNPVKHVKMVTQVTQVRQSNEMRKILKLLMPRLSSGVPSKRTQGGGAPEISGR